MARHLASRAGQLANFTATEEAAAHKMAKKFSIILGTYIDPYDLKIYSARGYWTHKHQDVQRFTGTFPRPDLPKLMYSFGSWDLNISQIAKGCRFGIDDCRGAGRNADADFMIERDASSAWYSATQLKETERAQKLAATGQDGEGLR